MLLKGAAGRSCTRSRERLSAPPLVGRANTPQLPTFLPTRVAHAALCALSSSSFTPMAAAAFGLLPSSGGSLIFFTGAALPSQRLRVFVVSLQLHGNYESAGAARAALAVSELNLSCTSQVRLRLSRMEPASQLTPCVCTHRRDSATTTLTSWRRLHRPAPHRPTLCCSPKGAAPPLPACAARVPNAT